MTSPLAFSRAVLNKGPRLRFSTAFTSRALLSLAFLAALASCASRPALGVDRVRKFDVAIGGLPDELVGYRIAFVSDIHYGNRFGGERLARLIDAVNALECDAIVLGGDHTLGTREIAPFAKEASRLKARHGVYAVLGNHDFFNGRAQSIRTLRKAGIAVLDETLVEMPGGLVIAGINDVRDSFPAMGRFRDILNADKPTILISHNPDAAEEIELAGFDAILSGHTHGGQITLFGYAPVIPSRYGQRYRSGLARKDGVPVIVSNGAGYGGMVFRFRLFAPSDIIEITLSRSGPCKDR